MANIYQDRKPATGRWSALPWVVAGFVGLAGFAAAGRTWQTPAPAANTNLKQAVSEFDAGHLTAATAAFRTLANRGDPNAAYWYGHALDRGLGTRIDTKAAIVQLTKASAGGVRQAGTRLGELYLDGNAVPPDFTKARDYLSAAARSGDARAALDLGRMMRDGMGTPADPVAAYAWLEVASLDGNARARVARDRLLPTLSPEQQAEAVKQAAAIVPSVAARTTAHPAKT